jgi:hypothetical protein
VCSTLQTESSQFRVTVQERDIRIADAELGWQDIAATLANIPLLSRLNTSGSVVWEGTIALPMRDAGRISPLLVETEQFEPWGAVSGLSDFATERATFVEKLTV